MIHIDFAALQGSTLSDDRMTTGFGPFELLTKCLWMWVWPWPRPRPCTKATRQETGKASRGEPLLDQHDSVHLSEAHIILQQTSMTCSFHHLIHSFSDLLPTDQHENSHPK